jgi:hypothetical protein
MAAKDAHGRPFTDHIKRDSTLDLELVEMTLEQGAYVGREGVARIMSV